MKRLSIWIVAACALAACGKVAPETEQSAEDAPAAFVINDLADNDIQIQGCSRTLSRESASAGAVFAEDAVDAGAIGFVRINGALIVVNLVSGNSSVEGGTRTFEDATHTTRIVETIVAGAAHEESDSVEETGTLEVTHHGAAQTLNVVGGTAC